MKILSIQSSVVHGYVGNRSATFPLQLLGNDVSCINTVQFSTHTGYPTIKGQKLNEQDISTLFEGLQANGITDFDGLLTGYISAEGIHALHKISSQLKSLWVLDPVMGDEERGLYVSPDIPALYKDLMLHADIITPNQFELQVLSDMEITDMASVKAACAKLHSLGVKQIVVTTFRDPIEPEMIKIVGSTNGSMFSVTVPYHSRPYQGTGDLFAALLLHYSLAGLALPEAVTRVLDTMAPVIQSTGAHFDSEMARLGITDWRADKNAQVCRASELRLIPCAKDMLDPAPRYSITLLN